MEEVDFYISHADDDENWGLWVAQVLESAGYTTFLMSRDFRPGISRIQAIEEASSRARRIIILLSPNYLGTAYSEAEWRLAFFRDPTGEQRILLPVRIAEFTPSGLLATRVWVDLVDLSEADATRRLLGAVQSGLPSKTDRPPFPGAPEGRRPKASVLPESAQSATAISGGRGKVFVSYSHRDRKWLDRLLVHLKPLERAGYLDVWEDSRIAPGTTWKEEIDNALRASQIAVLLISADFLASDFIADNEVPQLLLNAHERGTIIMPVIVSPSRFLQSNALPQFQALNPPEMPLTKMPAYRREEFFVGLASAIEDALASFRNTSES
jgi:TIR domain